MQRFYSTSVCAERVLGPFSVLTNLYRAAKHFQVQFLVAISIVVVDRKT